MEVPEFVRRGGQPIHIAIDSTGLKIMGNGEWHVLKHKTSNKRRAWRKLHLAVDGQGFIVASELTDSSTDDASVGVAMIERIEAEIARFTADEGVERPSDTNVRCIRHEGDLRGAPRGRPTHPPKGGNGRDRPNGSEG